jgi:hypothetical protein
MARMDRWGIGRNPTFDTVNILEGLDMNDSPISDVGYIDFNLVNGIAQAEGRLVWNDTDGTLNLGLRGGVVNLQIGQEVVVRAKNTEAVQINNGDVVFISGASGSNPEIQTPIASNPSEAPRTFAVATEDIPAGQFGYVTMIGRVRDFDTSGTPVSETWNDGDVLYLSATTQGKMTNVRPTPPNTGVVIGVVLRAHATEGSLGVNPTVIQTHSLSSDVLITSIADNDLTYWDNASSVWRNAGLSGIGTDLVEGEIVFPDSDGKLTGDPNLTWDGSLLTVNGNFQVEDGNTAAIGSAIPSPNTMLRVGDTLTSATQDVYGFQFFGIFSPSASTSKGLIVYEGTPLYNSANNAAYLKNLLVKTPFILGGGTITDVIGLEIEDQTGGTNNYAIYTNTGDVRFGDNVTIDIPTTTTEGLTINGIASQSSDYLNISSSTGTGDILTVLSSGNVGIGTSTPARKLHVYESTANTVALFESGTSIVGISLKDSATTNDLTNLIRGVGDAISIYSGGAETIYFSSSNKVGIGTSSPATELHVVGAKNSPGIASLGGITISDSSSQATGVGGALLLRGKYLDSGTETIGANIEAYKETAVSGEYGFGLSFATRENGSPSLAQRMYIDSTGYVGIGTNNPSTNLKIQDQVSGHPTGFQVQSLDSYTNTSFFAYSDTTWHGNFLGMHRTRGTRLAPATVVSGDAIFQFDLWAYDGTSDDRCGQMAGYIDGTVSTGIRPTKWLWQTEDTTGTLAVRMTLKNDGDLGLGTASPSNKLTVVPGSSGDGIVVMESDNINPAAKLIGYAGGGHLQLNENGVANILLRGNGGDSFFGAVAGNVKITRDNGKFLWGAGDDCSIYYDGTDMNIKTNEVAASDLLVDCGTNKTVELQHAVWDDLRVPITSIRLGGVRPPTETAYRGGLVAAFSSVSDNTIYFDAQLPHTYKQGTDIKVHIHWTLPTAGAGAGAENVKWDLTYSWQNIDGGTWPVESTATVTIDVQNFNADTHEVDGIATLSGTGKNISSMLICSLTRDVSVANDYGDDAYLVEVDFHYEIDTQGSRQEFIK